MTPSNPNCRICWAPSCGPKVSSTTSSPCCRSPTVSPGFDFTLSRSEVLFAHPGLGHVQGLLHQIEHFVYLLLTDDEGRAERQGIAHRPADHAEAFEELHAGRAHHLLDIERRLCLFVGNHFDGAHDSEPPGLPAERVIDQRL